MRSPPELGPTFDAAAWTPNQRQRPRDGKGARSATRGPFADSPGGAMGLLREYLEPECGAVVPTISGELSGRPEAVSRRELRPVVIGLRRRAERQGDGNDADDVVRVVEEADDEADDRADHRPNKGTPHACKCASDGSSDASSD